MKLRYIRVAVSRFTEMGSMGAMEAGSKDRYFQEDIKNWFRKA